MCVGQQFNAKYFLPCQTRRKLIVDVVLQPKRTLLPPDSVIWQTENDKCHCNFFLIPPPLICHSSNAALCDEEEIFHFVCAITCFFLQNGILLHGFFKR
jgi:hypothetical protein